METMSESTSEVTQDLPEGEVAPTPAIETAPASGTEQTSQTTETPAEPEPKKTPWFQRRIDELTREKHEERRQREALEARLRAAAQPQQQQQQPNAPQGYVPEAEVQRLVRETAQAAEFNRACNEIYEAGTEKHGRDFDNAVQQINQVGDPAKVASLLESITDLGKSEGAEVLLKLGKDPDEAARILDLPPRKQAIAIAKLALRPVAAIPVSRATPPITPVSTVSVRSDAEPDANDTKAWAAWFAKKRASR